MQELMLLSQKEAKAIDTGVKINLIQWLFCC